MNQIKTDEKIRIVGICGSLRDGSYTKKVMNVALAGAAELGDETALIDLREFELPFCDGSNTEAAKKGDVQKLRDQVKDADGVILGTPEYHGSFSGVLKNALDLMGFDEFEGKMLGLVSVSAGQLGGVDALTSLRTIGRALHAWVIPEQVSIPRVYEVFDENGRMTDTDLERRVKDVGRQVARFSYLHTSDRTNEFVRYWEEAPPNPGAQDR
ncbi:MAG: NAD(P)H-dependent oxidoreductase [Candidatus Marinimicrobia bacterium]|nr:NAD(P)H-dependent oxidoreductase [Candidatus Neomarinimicrobiota bacterium]MCF7828662.1 NAD(P)H-dependent oxidoreductase [Candidatus Neomarinimicrobiota bacterium]MCF7880403.1 NAD(P)H-dependent oxidoreductase [Candidatus Neomarinimicrobiota bacterium]